MTNLAYFDFFSIETCRFKISISELANILLELAVKYQICTVALCTVWCCNSSVLLLEPFLTLNGYIFHVYMK